MKYVFAAMVAVVVAAGVFAASNKIVVEAEKGVLTPSMRKTASVNASGKAFIEIPLRRPHATTETGPADAGNAKYSVTIPAAGSYRFWGRAHWYDSCGNAFNLKIHDKPWAVFGQDGTYQRWHWVKGPTVTLPAGKIQIIIQNREDGAKLDQFILTRDLNYVPVRAERATQ